MDVRLITMATVLLLLFIAAFLVSVIAWVLVRRRRRRTGSPDYAKWTVRIVGAALAAFLALTIGVWLVASRAAYFKFGSLTITPPSRLVMSSAAGKTELRDRAAIAELLRTIASGPGVWGHHSHPVDEVLLSFPDIGYTYSLGRDSVVADEFWLDLVAYPGSGSGFLQTDVHIRQFHSEKLADWFRKHPVGA